MEKIQLLKKLLKNKFFYKEYIKDIVNFQHLNLDVSFLNAR